MNNTKNKTLVYFIAILLFTNIAMLLYFTIGKSFLKDEQPKKRQGPVSIMLEKQIGFNAKQMHLFDSLKNQQRNLAKPLINDLEKSKEIFYTLINKANISDSMLQIFASDIGKKQMLLDIHLLKHFQTVRKICTPEQMIKFDSLIPIAAGKITKPWQRK